MLKTLFLSATFKLSFSTSSLAKSKTSSVTVEIFHILFYKRDLYNMYYSVSVQIIILKLLEFENKKAKIKAHEWYKNQYLAGSGRMAEAVHLAYNLKTQRI